MCITLLESVGWTARASTAPGLTLKSSGTLKVTKQKSLWKRKQISDQMPAIQVAIPDDKAQTDRKAAFRGSVSYFCMTTSW